MATIDQILRTLYRAKWQNASSAQVTLTYKEFKRVLLTEDIYSSDPSIRNAWTRVAGSGIVLAERSERKHPENRTYVFDLHALRMILGESRIGVGEKKEKKISTGEEVA